MSKGMSVILALVVGLILFFAANVLAGTSLRRLRFDLTEENLFTLSEGSKSIARDVEETIRLRLYFSQDVANDYPSYKSFGTRVRELLEEYVHASDGMIELEVLEPEPFSEVEDAAVRAGIYAVPLAGEKLYFGLVATSAMGDEEVIPFFSAGRERFLEYDISRIIYSLDNPERGVIGVLSTLPLDGGGFNPMMGMQQLPRWKILDHIESLFETRMLTDGTDEIPAEVDVLVIVHPKGLSEETLYAIDQYVLGGGKATVFVDPYCENDSSGNDPTNPLASMGAAKNSDLDRLLSTWGVELVKNRIAADRENALQVLYQQEAISFVPWLELRSGFLDEEDAVTSQLDTVRMPTPGILRKLPEAKTEFHKLMWTSTDSMDLDVGSIQFRTPPKELLTSFVPRHESYTLAARVSGSVPSAFPDGPPSDGDEDPAATAGEPDEEGADDEKAPPEGHLAESSAPINVIVVADCDMLADHFWVEEARFLNLSLGYTKTADNGDFVVNALENLGGGDDLISIRARGRFSRPFDRVQEIQREAEQKYLAEERELQDKLSATEQRINELRRQEGPENSLILSPEVKAEIDQAREEMVATNRALREVQHNLRKDIERLGFLLKLVNIGLLPCLITVGAVALGMVRIQRRKIT